MTEWGVVGVIVAILGLVGTFYKMFYLPMHELNLSIKLLIAEFEHSKESDAIRDKRLNSHSERIDKLHDKSMDHDSRIKILENTNFIKLRD